MLAYRNSTTDKIEFEQDIDQYSFPGATDTDKVVFACRNVSCFFKSEQKSQLSTFMSCDYNSILESDFSLTGRKCQVCPQDLPYSFGYAENRCSACATYEDVI